MITELDRGRTQGPDLGRIARVTVAGFISGAAIPCLFLLCLEMGLLVLELWRLWIGAAKLNDLPGRGGGGAFLPALGHSLTIILNHAWGLRWVAVVLGCLGMSAAAVGYCVARARRDTRGATFLTILAASVFVTNSAAMLLQEPRSSLGAAERVILTYYQLAESHWGVLVLATTVAFLLALIVWKLWRSIYEPLASRWGLLVPARPVPHQNPGPTFEQTAVEGRRTCQDHIHELNVETTHSYPDICAAPQEALTTDRSWPGWHRLGLALLVTVALWIPLQRAYLRTSPAVTSGVVYLEVDDPTELISLSIGSEPRSISFSSSIGRGVVDFRLMDSGGSVVREVVGFELMDLPGPAYNRATVSIVDLPAGTYLLCLALRPTESHSNGEDALEEPNGVIGWGLLQGGGRLFRMLAVMMAALTTVILIDGSILLAQGVSWFQGSYL